MTDLEAVLTETGWAVGLTGSWRGRIYLASADWGHGTVYFLPDEIWIGPQAQRILGYPVEMDSDTKLGRPPKVKVVAWADFEDVLARMKRASINDRWGWV